MTNEHDFNHLYNTICESLPPIAGVAHGAMVLRDTSIRDMTFEQMSDVLRPKIDGSLNLDKIFYTTELDFFVLFSSIHWIIGSMNQGNYIAANAFMSSLAFQRRKRGLAVSIINIGSILGAGIVTRQASLALEMKFIREGLISMSEDDFHQIFAEGILVGRSGLLDEAPEISAGLGEIGEASSYRPAWRTNPIFARWIAKDQEKDWQDTKSGLLGPVSVKDRLQIAKTQEEVRALLLGYYASSTRTR